LQVSLRHPRGSSEQEKIHLQPDTRVFQQVCGIQFGPNKNSDIAPIDSCDLLLVWAWFPFKTPNLDERSLYLRHEGHKMKLKFMTPRQVSKDQNRLKEKIGKERIEKEAIKTAEERENEKKKWK